MLIYCRYGECSGCDKRKQESQGAITKLEWYCAGMNDFYHLFHMANKQQGQRLCATSHSACSDACIQTPLLSTVYGVSEWEFCILPFQRQNLRNSLEAPPGVFFMPFKVDQFFYISISLQIPPPHYLLTPESSFSSWHQVHSFLSHLISKNMQFIKASSTLVVIRLVWERDVNAKRPPNAREAERWKDEVGKCSMPVSE